MGHTVNVTPLLTLAPNITFTFRSTHLLSQSQQAVLNERLDNLSRLVFSKGPSSLTDNISRLELSFQTDGTDTPHGILSFVYKKGTMDDMMYGGITGVEELLNQSQSAFRLSIVEHFMGGSNLGIGRMFRARSAFWRVSAEVEGEE